MSFDFYVNFSFYRLDLSVDLSADENFDLFVSDAGFWVLFTSLTSGFLLSS